MSSYGARRHSQGNMHMSSKLAKQLYARASARAGIESEVVAETSDESGTPIVETAVSVEPSTNPEFEAEHDAVDKVTALVRAAADATSAAEVVEEVQATRRAVVEFKEDIEAVNEAEGGIALESLPFVLIGMQAHSAAIGRPGLFVTPSTEGLSEDARIKIDVSALEAIIDTLDSAHPQFLKASAGEFAKMSTAIADALPEARDRLTTLLSDLQMDTRPLAEGSIDLSPELKAGLSVQGSIPEDLVTYFATYAELGKQLCGEYAQRAGASAEALVGLLGSLNYDHTSGFWDTLKEVLEKVGDPRQALGKDSIAIGLPGGSSLFEANEAPQTDGNPTFAAMAEYITVNAPVVGCDTAPQDGPEDPQLPADETGVTADGDQPALEGFVGGLLGFLFGGAGWLPFVGPAIHGAVKAKRLKLREDIQTISKRIAAARNGQIDEVAKKGTKLPKGLKHVDTVEIIKSALLGQFFGGLYGIHQGSDLENLNDELKKKIAELEKELEAAGMSSLESIGLEDIDALAADAAADPAADASADAPPADADPVVDPVAPADPVADAAAVDPGLVVDLAPAAPASDGLKALTRDQLRTLVKSILDLMDDGRVAQTLKGLERNWQATKAAVVESQDTVRSITGDVKDQLGVQTEIVPRYVKCVHELSVWPIANFLANLVFTANTVALLGTQMVSGDRAAEPTPAEPVAPIEAAPAATDPVADPAADPEAALAEGVADVTDEAADGGDPTNVEPLTPDPTPDPDAPLSQPALDDAGDDADALADPAADAAGDDLGADPTTPPEGGEEGEADPEASAAGEGDGDEADPLAAAGAPPEGEEDDNEDDEEDEPSDPSAPTA